MDDFTKVFTTITISLALAGVVTFQMNFNRYVNVFVKRFLFYFNAVWLETDALAQLIWVIEGLYMGRNIVDLSLTVPCVVQCNLLFGKISSIFHYKSVLEALMEKFKEIQPAIVDENDTTSECDIVKQNIVRKSIRSIFLPGIILSMAFVSVGSSFIIAPGIIMIRNVIKNGGSEILYPFETRYFIEPIHSPVMCTAVYIHHSVTIIIVCINTIGVDGTFYAFCTLIRMHFRLLSHHFEKELDFVSPHSTKDLVKLIVRHQEIIGLVQRMEVVFSKPILLHMVLSSILICMCLFNISFTDNIENLIKFCFFFAMCLMHIYLMCFFGDMLLTSSSQFSQSVYNSKWYDADIKVKKYIYFILMRSQTPCKISAAGFTDLTLITFTSILSTSWSYFALLRSMF